MIVFASVDAETTYDIPLLLNYYINKGKIEDLSVKEYYDKFNNDESIIHHVMEAIDNAWVPVQLHKVTALSTVVYTGDGFDSVNMTVPPTNTPEEFEVEEDKMLRQFMNIFKSRPNLYTWNGSNFDLLLLQFRCLKYNIQCVEYWNGPRYSDYRNRYDSIHTDLSSELYNNTNGRVNLNTGSLLCGYPTKSGIGGAEAIYAYHQGKSDEISQYCEVDTILLTCVALSYNYVRAQVTEDMLSQMITFLSKSKNPLLTKEYVSQLQQPLVRMLKSFQENSEDD